MGKQLNSENMVKGRKRTEQNIPINLGGGRSPMGEGCTRECQSIKPQPHGVFILEQGEDRNATRFELKS